MKLAKKKQGFTLVELLVAIMVTAIILSAVASLAFAISSANSGADEISIKQARLRAAKVRLTDLVKNCKMICWSSGTDVAIWKNDADNDNQIDTGELVYIDANSTGDSICLLEFNNIVGSSITMGLIKSGAAKNWLVSNYLKNNIALINNCQNVAFAFDVQPTKSSFISISFDWAGPDNMTSYEINAKMLANSANLTNESDEIISDDD